MGKDIEAINPATGEKIRTYETATDKQISSTFSKARDAFKQWKDLSIDKRCGYLRNLRKEIVERKRGAGRSYQTGHGKTRRRSFDVRCSRYPDYDKILRREH